MSKNSQDAWRNALFNMAMIIMGITGVFFGHIGMKAEKNPMSFENAVLENRSAKTSDYKQHVVCEANYCIDAIVKGRSRYGKIFFGNYYYAAIKVNEDDRYIFVKTDKKELSKEYENGVYKISGELEKLDPDVVSTIEEEYSNVDMVFDTEYCIVEYSEKVNQGYMILGLSCLILGILVIAVQTKFDRYSMYADMGYAEKFTTFARVCVVIVIVLVSVNFKVFL